MSAEYQTWSEIEKQYPGEWVLLDRPTADRNDDVTGGSVVMHATDRAEFDKKLADFRLRDSAVLYVYDPLTEPIYIISPWIDDSTPDETSSTPPG